MLEVAMSYLYKSSCLIERVALARGNGVAYFKSMSEKER